MDQWPILLSLPGEEVLGSILGQSQTGASLRNKLFKTGSGLSVLPTTPAVLPSGVNFVVLVLIAHKIS